jgi:hypothetical protein
MKLWPILLTALCMASPLSFAQNPESQHGVIVVRVVDATGNGVEDADVYAFPGPSLLPLPQCRTGRGGECEISDLSFGDYQIWAKKSGGAYPEMPMWEFFASPNQRTDLSLSAGHPVDEEVLNLGRRCGILTGTVTDAVTGKQLDAHFEFHWVSDPQKVWRELGRTDEPFRILVPSEIAITMTVSAHGYAPWTYTPSPYSAQNRILLDPGEELVLDIRLQPED